MAAYNNVRPPLELTLECHAHTLGLRNLGNQVGEYTCKSCEVVVGNVVRYSCRTCIDYNIHMGCARRLITPQPQAPLVSQAPLVPQAQSTAGPSMVGNLAAQAGVSVGSSIVGRQLNNTIDAHRQQTKTEESSTVARSVDPTGLVGHADNVDPSGWVTHADYVDPTDWVNYADNVDPAGWVDHADNVDPSGWVNYADSSVDPAGWVDHADTVDSTGLVDHVGTVEHEETTGGIVDFFASLFS